MPALSSEGSVVALKNGKYRAELVIGWKADNQKITKTRTCRTRALARAALRDLANERDAGGIRNQGARRQEPVLADWCRTWLERHAQEKGIEASTADRYDVVIRNWIVPLAGQRRLSLVTPASVRTIMSALTAKPSTRRQTWIVLNSALKLAVRDRLIGRNPCDDLTPPRVRRAQVNPPMDDAVEAIYRVIDGEPDEARWRIALELGPRQGEALGLEWDAVDFTEQTITIRQQLRRVKGVHGCGTPKPLGGKRGYEWPCGHKWASKCPQGTAGGYTLKPVKTTAGNRVLPMLPGMAPLLEELQRRQGKQRILAAKRYKPLKTGTGRAQRDTDFVFRTPYGRPVDPRADSSRWHAILEQAGVDPAPLHAARHSAAVGMLDAGVPLADLLGHTSRAFSEGTYGHFSKRAANEARNALGRHHDTIRKAARQRGVKPVPMRESAGGTIRTSGQD